MPALLGSDIAVSQVLYLGQNRIKTLAVQRLAVFRY